MKTLPHLVHFRVSHYNEKVRWALDHKRIPHTREALTPGLHVPRARSLSGQNQVPILVLDGAPLIGSSHILQELERRWPEPALYPEAPDDRRRALAIERYFDEEVAPDLRRLFWSAYLDDAAACTRMATDGASSLAAGAFRALLPVLRPAFRRNMGMSAPELTRARERLPEHFERLEREIGPSGFLVGDRFGVADLAAAAVMTAIVRPKEFPYPLPEPWPAALVELRASVERSPAFAWVLSTYARHRDASAEA